MYTKYRKRKLLSWPPNVKIVWVPGWTALALAILIAAQVQAAPLILPENLPAEPPRSHPALTRMLEDLAGQQGQVVAIQRELIKRPALNPEHQGEGEHEKAQWIEDWLREQGYTEVMRLDSPDERVPTKMRPNLVIQYPDISRPHPGRTLWLIAQMDINPPGELMGWQGTPYAVRVDGDYLHGAGAEDNNQGITSCLLLLETLKRHQADPPLRLGVIFTAGGNSNRDLGIDYVLNNRPELFSPDDLFVLFEYGDRRGAIIDVAEKRYLWLKVSVRGRPAFAAHPYDAINPVPAAVELMRSLSALQGDFHQTNPLFLNPGNFFTLTRVEETNQAVNYIPGQMVFHMDIRLLPECDPAEVMKAVNDRAALVERQYQTSISVEQVGLGKPGPPLPTSSHLVQELQGRIKDLLEVEARAVGLDGTTLANYLRFRGFQAVAWSIHRPKKGVKTENAAVSAHLSQSQVLLSLLFSNKLNRPAQKAALETAPDPGRSVDH